MWKNKIESFSVYISARLIFDKIGQYGLKWRQSLNEFYHDSSSLSAFQKVSQNSIQVGKVIDSGPSPGFGFKVGSFDGTRITVVCGSSEHSSKTSNISTTSINAQLKNKTREIKTVNNQTGPKSCIFTIIFELFICVLNPTRKYLRIPKSWWCNWHDQRPPRGKPRIPHELRAFWRSCHCWGQRSCTWQCQRWRWHLQRLLRRRGQGWQWNCSSLSLRTLDWSEVLMEKSGLLYAFSIPLH